MTQSVKDYFQAEAKRKLDEAAAISDEATDAGPRHDRGRTDQGVRP